MGHEVRLFESDHYYSGCSYLAKKIDKLGFHSERDRYCTAKEQAILTAVREWQPDRLLFINTPQDIISVEAMGQLQTECHRVSAKTVLWIVDVIKGRDDQTKNYYQFFDNIYVFEQGDRAFLKKQFNIKAEYCPVGYNKSYDLSDSKTVPYKYDIVFIGMPYKNRMAILEAVAGAAKQRGWRVGIFGPFYDEARYFWKKYQRKHCYPNLCRYVHNGRWSPQEVAKLYRSAKICLNIHISHAKGMNPRTFEIMATGSFELIDERDYYDKVIPGKHLEVFKDSAELIRKIDYYLPHEKERLTIAAEGRILAAETYTIEQSLERVLK